MLSVGEDVEASALSRRGWSISAIARHLDRDRKTVRSYLAGERQPGVRRPAAPDPLAPFAPYVMARFADDPHLWASALFDEVVPLGYDRSYVSLARQLRLAGLRPRCEACSGVTGRETIEISHPAGEEIQWDWFERRRAPGPPMSCSARCPTRGGPAASWPSAWTRPTWWRRWTR
jgi:hypothetical protein